MSHLIIRLHLFDFEGRANRAEFAAFFFGGLVAFYLLALAGDFVMSKGDSLFACDLLAMTLLLTICVGAAFRRLHDLRRSGWTLLLVFIPLASLVLFLMLFFAPGKPQAAHVDSPSEKSSSTRQQDAQREKTLFRKKLGYPDDRTRMGSTETMPALGAREGNAVDEDAYQQETGEEEWLRRRRERGDEPTPPDA